MNFSLQRLLVIIGLIAIPFYELIFKVFPYIKVMAPDTRAPKELISLWFALAIGLLAIFQGKIKPFNNKFLLFIPLYLLLNLWMAPPIDFFINEINSGDFYFWKPFAEVLCFVLMIIAIASSDDDFKPTLKIMVWCGTVMSIYVILQTLGFDQFWIQREGQQFEGVSGRLFAGNLGQPTLVSSFIVMLVPLAFYFKRYWMAVLMIIAIFLTKSDMSLVSLFSVLLIYIISKIPNMDYKKFISIFLVIFVLLGIGYLNNNKFKSFLAGKSSGRIAVWSNIIDDIRDGPVGSVKQDFSATGVGFGRFPFIFSEKHKSNFKQVHNDPLEFMYNCGIFGEYLILAAIFFMITRILINISSINIAILLSFIAIFINSLGSFPFQLGAHQFYSAILVGLLHKSGGMRC